MSRLSKQLYSYGTGKHVLVQPIKSLTVHEQSVIPYPTSMLQEFRIEAKFSAACLIDEGMGSKSGLGSEYVWADAIRVAKRKIIEEVFGEFRPILYHLNEAAHDRDWEEVNRGLQTLYSTMFEEGV